MPTSEPGPGTEIVYKYLIMPRCMTEFNEELYLTSNPQGGVYASTPNENWSYQVWILEGQRYGQFSLQNADNGLWLATIKNRAPVQLFPTLDGLPFVWSGMSVPPNLGQSNHSAIPL